jgi:glycosyltransferase involved in cell wall biosynthesis
METVPPLVSVVLPTYDRTGYLRRAVESVLTQTYGNIELIIVDDRSPTPASEVLSTLPSDRRSRIRHIRHEENRGANAARNTGIEATSGEFVAFLDDDDVWERTKIERQVEVFDRAGPDVGVVYTGSRLIDDDDNDLMVDIPEISGRVTRDILAGRSAGEFSVLMVRSDVIDAAGRPDERLPSWQDLEWCLRLSEHCEFEPVPEPLMIRQTGHEGRISQEFEAKRDVSYPLFMSKHRDLAAEYGPEYERLLVASLSWMLGLAAIKNGYYADARKYLLRSIRKRPFSLPSNRYLYVLASLGGGYTYRSSQRTVRSFRSVRSYMENRF